MRRSKNEAFAMSEIAFHSAAASAKTSRAYSRSKYFLILFTALFFARKISFFVLFLKLGGENCRLYADFVFPSCA